MERTVVAWAFVLTTFLFSAQCDRDGEEFQQTSDRVKLIEHYLQAKLPPGVTGAEQMMISSYSFHLIGKLKCGDDKLTAFLANGCFAAGTDDDIFLTQPDPHFPWWRPASLQNAALYIKTWEYRNEADTLITVHCRLLSGIEPGSTGITIYYEVAEF